MLGYIDNRLKYVARKNKAFMAETASTDQNQQNSDDTGSAAMNNGEAIATTSDEVDQNMCDLINEMKSWTIDVSNLSSMKNNLRKTRDHRQKMLWDQKTDLLESFPYFFVNNDLVRIQYYSIFEFV